MIRKFESRAGTTFIDVIVSLGIIAILFGGILLVYLSILNTNQTVEARGAAASVIDERIEAIRNLAYNSVGTVNGIPSGQIPQQQTVTRGSYNFLIKTNIRNIDDPFDGVFGGVPSDIYAADYKLVTIDIDCLNCQKFSTMAFSTIVAPKNLESAGDFGVLTINVQDGAGLSVPGASVRIVNASVTPSIDISDTTNASGTFQIIGAPISNQRYQIYVGKPGYSSDQAYLPGAPSNPNPLIPYATVANHAQTTASFSIDRTSQLSIVSSDYLCAPVASQPFSLSGAKLIGQSPGVLKFSTTTQTDSVGQKNFAALEWDSYNATTTGGVYDLSGSIPALPIIINPNSSYSLRLIMTPAAHPALLVNVVDGISKNSVSAAAITVSRPGYSSTKTAGRATVGNTDWSSNQYASQSGQVDADSTPGKISLLWNASSGYPLSNEWLISKTFDLGGPASFYSLSWNPAAQPGQTGPSSLKFQLAANNDNATWNFVGPDGTANTYYDASGGSISGLNGNRYLRYKVYLSTADSNFTPQLNDTAAEFDGPCTPDSEALFQNLSASTNYTVSVTAPGYATSTIVGASTTAGWSQITVPMF